MNFYTRRKTYLLGFFVVFFSCFGFFLYQFYTGCQTSRADNPGVFRVERSTSARSFVRLLKTQHMVRSEAWFLISLRLRGLSTKLQAGYYQIQPGESAEHLLQRVVQGDRLKMRFQIIEGTHWSQILTNLTKAPYLSFNLGYLFEINAKKLCTVTCAQNIQTIEGLLLADTYQYEAGSSAKPMLLLAHQHLTGYLLKAWNERESSLPYQTPYELLIAASILEKETAISSERHLISGVIVNRLIKKMPLQMDPTVIYGLESRYHGTLAHDDLKDDSPYNTYRHRGLPPTPIAMVSRDAIDAAAHPAKTQYLYFVAKGDGTHVFSETYNGQREAIRHYIRNES